MVGISQIFGLEASFIISDRKEFGGVLYGYKSIKGSVMAALGDGNIDKHTLESPVPTEVTPPVVRMSGGNNSSATFGRGYRGYVSRVVKYVWNSKTEVNGGVGVFNTVMGGVWT